MKYKLGLGLGAVLVTLVAIDAIKDSAISKHEADVRKAEIAAEVKRKEEAKNKRKGNNKKI